VVISRFDICLVRLDPTEGHELQKTCPCLVISPDELNRHLGAVIVAPMTTARRPYPTRVAVSCQGKEGQIVLDQIRTVDKRRLVDRLGTLDPPTAEAVLDALRRLFAP
jgi:mRNA interferase MazF